MNKIMIIGLIILLSLIRIAAAENISFTISCTIPAIPGVNVPPFEEETEKTKTEQAVMEEAKSPQEKAKTESSIMIQTDTQKEIGSVEGRTSSVLVKTVYAR